MSTRTVTEAVSEPRSSARLWGIIPAAGVGQRMLSRCPKQYLMLGTSTVLEVSAEKLLTHLPLSGLAIAIADQDEYWPDLPLNQHPKVVRVTGGAERSDSVLAGVTHWLQSGAHPDDWVLVHDAARPCVHAQCLASLWKTVQTTQEAAILATPSADTLKWSDSGDAIARTLNRSHVWQAQTPQMARLGQLHDALQQAQAHSLAITDEASALEAFDQPVRLVAGRRDNLKITHPEDLALAEFLLQQQS